MNTIKLNYKGNDYTLTVRGNDLAYAFNSQGYAVCNPSLLNNLAIALNN
jgi:hypothetical protein